jgi:gas vesicle protein
MGKKSHFGLGMLIGGVAGAIGALLMAPQTGEKTREWVKKKAEENQDTIDQAKKLAKDTGEKVFETAKEAKEAIEEKISELKASLNKCCDKEGGE